MKLFGIAESYTNKANMSKSITYTIFYSEKLDNDLINRKKNVDAIHKNFAETFEYLDAEVCIVQNIKDYKSALREDASLRKLKIKGSFRLGALGLLITTYRAYKKMLKTKNDIFIIFEDDAQIFESSLSNIIKYIEQLPEDFDILSLYENPNFYENYEEALDCGISDLCISYNRMSTLAYVISTSGIEKYLFYMESLIDNPLDFFLFDPKKNTRQYAIKPSSMQVVYSDFFRKDNGEPINEYSQINNTVEIEFL